MLKKKTIDSEMDKLNKYPLVSIVIVNWNKLEDTISSIEYAKKIDYPNFEIIIVDNGSKDYIRKKLKSLDNIKYVQLSHNTGFTGGHIAGLEASEGEYIVLLNNDAAIDKDYVKIALQHFKRDENIAAVGGRAYWWDDENPVLSRKNKFYSYQTINPITAEAITHQEDSGVFHEANNVSGSCVVISKKSIISVGYLFDDFFAYYEETDLFARMKRAGFKVIYDPNLAIWHKVGSSSTPYFQYKQLFKNRFLFAYRNFDSIHLKMFLRNYIKIGVTSTIKSLNPFSKAAIHRAFRNAFFYNVINFPKILKSRQNITKELGESTYNRKLYVEQSLLSFVIVADKENTYLKDWISYAKKHEEHEFVIVSKKDSDINLPNNMKLVVDLGLADTFSENIGWLSSKNQFVIFSSLKNKPMLTNQELGDLIWKLKLEKLKIVCGNESKIDSYIIERDLLIKSGGIFMGSDFKDGIDNLLYYSIERFKRNIQKKVVRYHFDNLPNKNIIDEINFKILFDKRSEASSTVWSRFIDKHYRLFQLRNYTRWLFSSRVSFRLKIARTKNLFLFALSLNRKEFATELKHIRNELIKATPGMFNITQQNEQVSKMIPELTEDYTSIPVFIICRDRLDGLEKLLERIKPIGMKNIFIIDNDSIYPPLVKFLNDNKLRYQILPTGSNVGHTVPWDSSIIKTLVPKSFYIVTDPDVIPIKDCPETFIKDMLNIHGKYRYHQKVGLGLKIDDLPDHYELRDSVIEWESQFWKNSIEENLYEAGVDTTFALYKPFTYNYFINPSIRTGGLLMARHLPWYSDSRKTTPEDIFYKGRASSDITSWNLDDLPDRYKKEMGIE